MKSGYRGKMLSLLLTAVMLVLVTGVAIAAELDGSMAVSRTLKAGADECYDTVANVTAGDNIKLLGRNASGTWVFVWSDAGDGWAPASSVSVGGDVATLNVWTDHFDGASCEEVVMFDSRICGRPGNTTAANTTRWTDIFATADPETTTGRAYTPNTAVTITGRDFWGCWVSVQGGGDSGWVPVNSLDQLGVLDLPILVDNSMGCTIEGGQVFCPQP